jgi:hypothetical protein
LFIPPSPAFTPFPPEISGFPGGKGPAAFCKAFPLGIPTAIDSLQDDLVRIIVQGLSPLGETGKGVKYNTDVSSVQVTIRKKYNKENKRVYLTSTDTGLVTIFPGTCEYLKSSCELYSKNK